MDPVFSFAWITSILKTVPPPLAAALEEVSQKKGFSRVLLGLRASPYARKHLHAALAIALDCEAKDPALIANTEREIMMGVQLILAPRK